MSNICCYMSILLSKDVNELRHGVVTVLVNEALGLDSEVLDGGV